MGVLFIRHCRPVVIKTCNTKQSNTNTNIIILLNQKLYDFKAQSDKLIGYNSFKCNLIEEGYRIGDEYFTINQKHLKSLPGITDPDISIGEYGKLRNYEIPPPNKWWNVELEIEMDFQREAEKRAKRHSDD